MQVMCGLWHAEEKERESVCVERGVCVGGGGGGGGEAEDSR